MKVVFEEENVLKKYDEAGKLQRVEVVCRCRDEDKNKAGVPHVFELRASTKRDGDKWSSPLIKTTLDVFCIDELEEFRELVLEVVDLLKEVLKSKAVAVEEKDNLM